MVDRSLLNLVIMCVGLAAIIAFGAINLISPRLYDKFVAWYSRVDRWSSPRLPQPEVSYREKRGFGALFLVFGLIGVVGLALHGYRPVVQAPPQPMTSSPAHVRWDELVVAGIAIISGVWLIVRPQVLVKIATRNFPSREISGETRNKATLGGWILGGLILAFGLLAALLALQVIHP